MLEFVISPLLHEKEDIMNAKRQAARFVRNISVDAEGKVSALDHLFAVLGPKTCYSQWWIHSSIKIRQSPR